MKEIAELRADPAVNIKFINFAKTTILAADLALTFPRKSITRDLAVKGVLWWICFLCQVLYSISLQGQMAELPFSPVQADLLERPRQFQLCSVNPVAKASSGWDCLRPTV